MSNVNFGLLKKVKNVRNYWPREDTDFTPWLGSEENISILGDAIGLELEVLEQERNVGPFRADILCKNTADNTYILIENQLSKTDHSHLGQLFTYAAGLDAVTLIWIVETFTEEHRAALDWLNRITDDKFQFFGIEIELWTIGDSPPAPKFNIVSKPNDWSKTVKESAEVSRSKLSPWQELQVEFWRSFGDHIDSVNAPFKRPKPYPSLWVGYGVGKSGTGMIVAFSQKETLVYVEVKKDRTGWFEQLASHKDEIEADLGYSLDWQEREGTKQSRAQISQELDMTNQDNWPAAIEWMLEHMAKIKTAFKPHVMDLSNNIETSIVEDNEE